MRLSADALKELNLEKKRRAAPLQRFNAESVCRLSQLWICGTCEEGKNFSLNKSGGGGLRKHKLRRSAGLGGAKDESNLPR